MKYKFNNFFPGYLKAQLQGLQEKIRYTVPEGWLSKLGSLFGYPKY